MVCDLLCEYKYIQEDLTIKSNRLIAFASQQECFFGIVKLKRYLVISHFTNFPMGI